MSIGSIGKRIRTLREEKHISQAELARRIGIRPASLSELESGKSKKPAGLTLLKLIRELGTTGDYIMTGHYSKGSAMAFRAEHAEGRVPVVGIAQAGNDGYWRDMEYPVGHGDGFIRYPTNDHNAYALRVKGDSMRPRIKPGEFLLVEPKSALIPGEEVLVTTKDGRSMVKILGPRRNGIVEFHSLNEDHRPITLEESDIRYIHYIAAIVKSGRFYRDET